jgi:hypothetical protein
MRLVIDLPELGGYIISISGSLKAETRVARTFRPVKMQSGPTKASYIEEKVHLCRIAS